MNKLKLILLFSILQFGCQAQNFVNVNQLTINGEVFMGRNVTILDSTFGIPYEIEKSYSEMDEVDMDIYKFDGLTFYVMNDTINKFEITNSKYLFTNKDIKIGDYINSLSSVYTESYSKKGPNYLILYINEYEEFVSITFDKNTMKITNIRIGIQ